MATIPVAERILGSVGQSWDSYTWRGIKAWEEQPVCPAVPWATALEMESDVLVGVSLQAPSTTAGGTLFRRKGEGHGGDRDLFPTTSVS